MSERKLKEVHCRGCRDDYYNSHGSTCWNFKPAEFEDSILVRLDERPPYKQHIFKKRLSCYRRSGYAKINREGCRRNGWIDE